jgi:streptomycin 6-kinase
VADRTLAGLIDRWSLTPDGAPLATATAKVQFVRCSGRRLVLKLITHDDEAGQPAILESYAGRGAVRLIERDGPAMLLERAWPGRPLSQQVREGADDSATGILADIMGELHAAPVPDGLRTVEDWGAGFARKRAATVSQGDDPDLIDRAAQIYGELCRSQGERRLLHGDLHHDNVLEDEDRGWLAIDPKGVVGEAAYEAGALLRNPGPDPRLFAEPRIIRRRAGILAERLNLELERIVAWGFAQAVLAALWFVEDGLDPSLAWRAAKATRLLL